MECSICHQNLTNYIVHTNCQCNHSYHKKCIEKWLNISRSCPTCRKTFIPNPFKKDTKQIELIKQAMYYDSIGRYNQFTYNNLIR